MLWRMPSSRSFRISPLTDPGVTPSLSQVCRSGFSGPVFAWTASRALTKSDMRSGSDGQLPGSPHRRKGARQRARQPSYFNDGVPGSSSVLRWQSRQTCTAWMTPGSKNWRRYSSGRVGQCRCRPTKSTKLLLEILNKPLASDWVSWDRSTDGTEKQPNSPKDMKNPALACRILYRGSCYLVEGISL